MITARIRPGHGSRSVSNTLGRMGDIREVTLTLAWLTAQRAEGIAPTTLGERMRVMARFTEHLAAEPELATTDQIAEWFSIHFDTWGPATKSSYYGHLRAFYVWLVRMDHRTDDPMAKIKRAKVPRTQPRPVPDEHMPRLLAAAGRRRTKAMILLGALAGLRVSEIARVRGEDFDLLGGTLRVLGKGGVVAFIAVHPLLAAAAAQMPQRGPWFPTRTGNRSGRDCILGRSVSTIIGHTMRRACVPGTAHSLRHWFGTTLVDDGTDMRTVQELLRHASLQTVQIYTRVRKAKKAEAVGRLDPYRSRAA